MVEKHHGGGEEALRGLAEEHSLDRLKITVGIPEALRTARFVRTEQRRVTLLLRALEEIRKELIWSAVLAAGDLPAGERSLILKKPTDLGQMRTFAEAAVALREWRRYYLRAQEIGASLLPCAPGCCIGEGDAAGESWRAASLSGCPGADTVGARHHAHGAEHLELLRIAACGDGYGKVDDSGNGQGEGDGHRHRSGKACSGLCEKGDEYNGVQVLWSLGKRVQMESRLAVSRGSECAVLDLWVEAAGEKGQPAKSVVKAAAHEPRDGSSGPAGASWNAGGAEKIKKSGTAPSTGGGMGGLLAEATQLLRSMRAPSAKAMVVIKEMNTAVINKGLLDGGATHALRKCKDLEEWEAATPTKVILAEGTTSRMRLKDGTLTLIAQEDIQPIVPMGVLTMMGYEVEWKQGHCKVRRRGKSLEVEMVDSCPMIEAKIALGLIEEMERMEENHMLRLAAMKMPMEQLKDRPELVGSGWCSRRRRRRRGLSRSTTGLRMLRHRARRRG